MRAQRIETLTEELDYAREMMRVAEETWLPVWAHESYDRHVQPAVKLWNEVRRPDQHWKRIYLLACAPSSARGWRADAHACAVLARLGFLVRFAAHTPNAL